MSILPNKSDSQRDGFNVVCHFAFHFVVFFSVEDVANISNFHGSIDLKTVIDSLNMTVK